MKKSKQLRTLINSDKLEFICEAHNGLSAKIVEETGFKGIWGSGLSISASLGVRDNNEASWTQVLEVIEFMSDATAIPILLDGDTGYGNFNNMRRLVQKLEQREIGGVCIEDKLFPKTNSFIGGELQPLADIDEFCGKIKAGKDTQKDDDFCIVARVEAFIAGYGLEMALKRAEAYRRAGADAILVHSKKSTPHDIELFMKEWGDRHPVVIVPTKYYSTPTDRFQELGISLVIWANHLIRTAAEHMKRTARTIFEDQSLVGVEDKIVPVSEIFRLQGASELQEAEKKYLPASGKVFQATILAASQGKEMGDITRDCPKALLKINDTPILHDTVEKLNRLNIKDITVVRGYLKDMIDGAQFKTIDNDAYDSTKDLYSLYLALDRIQGDSLIIYGDCLYRSHLFADLLDNPSDIRIIVDADISGKNKSQDLVLCSKPYANDFFNTDIFLKDIFIKKDKEDSHGEWTGLIATNQKGSDLIRQKLKEMASRENFKRLSITDLLKALLEITTIQVIYTKGGWLDIDDIFDYQQAGDF
ncbi:MAG: phosphoenolpyruvate mutase [Proteobacteria bacterium]|nr:phosphoenolpyruvate mutase [Pseudomonadota bacterium]